MRKLAVILFLFPLIVFCQDDFEKSIRQKVQLYYRQQVPMKLYLSLNQSAYLPGDTIFYRANLVSSTNLVSIRDNTILHVLLKDQNERVVIKQAIRMRKGEGFNQMIIPFALPQGKYVLHAYNERDTGIDEKALFKKDISIGSNGNKNENVGLNFYPEGKSFIAGLNQKIVVRGVPNRNGTIYDQSMREVAKFSLDQFGSGFFSLIPQHGIALHARYDNDPKTFLLPAAQSDGATITLTRQNDNAVHAIFQMPQNSTHRQNKIYLIGFQRHKIFYVTSFQMDDKPFVAIDIQKQEMPHGVVSFLLLTQDHKVLCERIIFNKSEDPPATIALDKRQYATREKITTTVKLPWKYDSLKRSVMSLTVVKKEADKRSSMEKTIVDHLGFYNEFEIEGDPAFISHGDSASLNIADNYLISQNVLHPFSENANNLQQRRLAGSVHISGKIITSSGSPVPDSSEVTFLLRNDVSVYKALVVRGNFKAYFLSDFFGEEDVFYRVDFKGDRIAGAKVILNNEAVQESAYEKKNAIETSSFYDQRRRINESFHFYQQNSQFEKPVAPHSFFEEEIFGADIEIKLSDYLLFPTMEETLREIIPMVQNRNVKGKNNVRVIIEELNKLGAGSPLFVIDGVVTEDSDFFLSLKPADVETVKVIYSLDKLNVFGALGKGGIILVETNIPDHAAKIPKSENTFSIEGLSRPITPLNFAHSPGKNERVPDLRTALYWNPEAIADGNNEVIFSFFTSDVTGNFVIKAEGITSDGKPFYAEENFSVKYAPAVSK
jgi:hypothetical protein